MKKLPVFLLALIALGIGFTVHSVRHSEKTNSPQADSQGQAKSSRNRSHNDGKNLIKTLGKNLNSTGGDEAWFRWLAYLENASLLLASSLMTLPAASNHSSISARSQENNNS